jgi:hypothetical protein
MLQKHTRLAATTSTNSKSSSRARPRLASRLPSLRCHAIHKEYARQGATQEQQQQQQQAAPAAQQQQLLSVPEDIVLECLTILR